MVWLLSNFVYYPQVQDEPLFVPTYAKFCKAMASRIAIKEQLCNASKLHFVKNYKSLLDFEAVRNYVFFILFIYSSFIHPFSLESIKYKGVR